MKSDSLFQLVRSLGQGELRYVRNELAHSSTEAGKIRFRILETIVAMKSYSGDSLKLELSDIKSARLALEKNKLFSEVCTKVALLNHRQTDHTNLLLGIAECELLTEKGLSEEALERCEKLAEVAFTQGEIAMEFQLRERMRIVLKSIDRVKHEKQIIYNHNRLTTLSEQLANLNDLRLARDEVQDLVTRYRKIVDGKMKRGLKRVMKRPVLQDARMAMSFEAQLCFHSAWRFYYDGFQDEESAYLHGLEMLKVWEINPERLKLKPEVYITAVATVGGALVRMGRFDEVPSIIQRIKKLELTEPKHRSIQFVEYQLKLQLLSLNQGKLDDVIANEPELMKGLGTYSKYIAAQYRINFLYNQAIAYTLAERFGKAIEFFTLVVSERKMKSRHYIQMLSMVTRLLLLSWTDDGGSIQHYLRNFGKYFSGEKKPSELRTVVYEYCNSHWTSGNQKEQLDALKFFVEECRILTDKKVPGAEEIWLVARARLEGIPAINLFRESLGLEPIKKP